MKKLIRIIFPLHTTDMVMAVFNRAIAKLERVAENHKREAEIHSEIARKATGTACKCETESTRARNVANKLKALIGNESATVTAPNVSTLRQAK